MRLIEKVFSFYVFSNMHVALSTSCLVLLTLKPYQLSDDRSILFVFCGTILAYSFIRAVQMDRLYPSLSLWIRSSARWLLAINIFALLGLVYSAFQYSWHDLFFVFPFFVLTLFYVIPFRGTLRGFRNLPGFKLFLIAAVWSGVTVLFPIWVNDLSFDGKVWVTFVQRFLFVLAITVPFDIRDLQLDDPDLATLPQTIGVSKSKLLAIGALLVFALLFFSGDYFMSWEQWSGMATALVSAGFILKAGVYQSRFYSGFWVEGIPILWLVLEVAAT